MKHHLQKQILDVLSHADSLRYVDINQAKLEGNVFTYHIKQLLSDKLITQNVDKTYSLTPAGRSYIVHRYEDRLKSAHSIFLVIIRHNGKLLLRRRLVQPMLGYSGFIHGEPMADQPLETSITERVQQKTGLTLTSLKINGSGLIRMAIDGEMNNFSHAIIVTAEVDSDDLTITKDATGENYWIAETTLETQVNLLPSCRDIVTHCTGPAGWFDYSYTL